MTVPGTPQKSKKFEIQAYQRPRDLSSLLKDYVAFSGTPQEDPTDSDKVILLMNPLSTHTFYYEFRRKDISYAEELPTLVNLEGDSVTMTRIWVKKGSVGLRCTPFIVADTTMRR